MALSRRSGRPISRSPMPTAAATSAINLRKSLMLQVKDRATRAVNFVGGPGAWDQYLPAVKQAADKVRNFKPTKKATPPPADGAPPAKKRMTGQQSYGDIDGPFEKLIEAIKLVPGYAPTPESQIQVATLSTLQTNYRAANKSAATTDAAMTKAERARKAIYDGAKDSLRTKMKAIKKATRGQYGPSSAEFAQVKSIRIRVRREWRVRPRMRLFTAEDAEIAEEDLEWWALLKCRRAVACAVLSASPGNRRDAGNPLRPRTLQWATSEG